MSVTRAFAPGRVELLGNHTDYNEGYVLSAALHFGVTAVGERSLDGMIRLRSESMNETVVLRADEPLAPLSGEEAWANYPLGVVQVLREAGHEVGAFRADFTSTLPPGAGLSSSAALEVATATLLVKLFDLKMSPMDLARLCRRAENTFVGVNCGLLDQASSIFGKDGAAVFLDCRSESVDNIFFPKGIDLLITHSGVKHALVGGEYNERREQCIEAAHLLGVPTLRDADTALLERAKVKMPDVVYRRARHVIGENERVLAAVKALAAGDAKVMGRAMFESHESSRINFENSAPELDVLVEIASKTEGILGSRLTGGGFGGATISLLDSSVGQAAADRIAEEFRARTGIQCRQFLCRPSAGAR
jgi:galactokinase